MRILKDVFAVLPADISRHFRESAVCNLSANVDMSTVEMIFLPILLHGNHWRLPVFNVPDCAVEYGDGFHYPVTSSVQELSGKTLKFLKQLVFNASSHRSGTKYKGSEYRCLINLVALEIAEWEWCFT